MNKSITVAVASVNIMVASRIIMGIPTLLSGQVSWIRVLFPIVVAILILVGIVRGQRLAWQWGRMLGLAGAIILTITAVTAFAASAKQPGMIIVAFLIALQGIPLFPMFFALGTEGARGHFRVICPACGNRNVKGTNFLFTKVLCKNCGTTWS